MTNRCVDIVVGLQAGSEAKGKLVTALAHISYKAICRSGSVNAAHTNEYKGKSYTFHQLPCGALHFPKAKLVIGANAQIDHEYLLREIEFLKNNNCWLDDQGKPRLLIDPNATIIESIDKIAENGGRMPDCGDMYYHPRDCDKHAKLGGTCIGCSSLPADSALFPNGSEFDFASYVRSRLPEDATNDQIGEFVMSLMENGAITDWASSMKVSPIKFADADEVTKPFVGDTVDFLNRCVDRNEAIMLEGTQGSVLSLHFGTQGKTTSRDTNASAWTSEAGISPLAVRDVYGVARTYPIRVAGDSGPMPGDELTWEEITKLSGSKTPIVEVTSATKRQRRVSTLGEEAFRRALDLNRPTKLMLSFVDYLDANDYGKSSWDSLSQKTRDWITILESKMGVFFNYLSTGPNTDQLVIRKSPAEQAIIAQQG